MVPRDRQTLFFSATMPASIRELASQFLRDPATVSIKPAATTAERVDQYATFVNQSEKQALLTITLSDPSIERALVFTRTKHGADRVVRLLGGNGIASNAIHGNKSQGQRERALGLFKTGAVKVLVATDIAARGIDVSGVSHVINFELPNVPEQYVHRIGRTARAGASGIAISFVADDEKPYLRDIEKVTRQKVPLKALPEGFLAEAARLASARKSVLGSDPAPREERPRGPRGVRPPRATHSAQPTSGGYRGRGGQGGGNGGGGGQGGQGGGNRRRGGRGGQGGGGRPSASAS
jgi:ATP-dependent RNA helicase RhlE